jgi:hypothetical protein
VRRVLLYTTAGLISALWLTNAGAEQLKGTGKGGAAKPVVLTKEKIKELDAQCSGDFGTSIHFLKTPSDAAKQALKEEKLVFVLHVSGEFEDPDFT